MSSNDLIITLKWIFKVKSEELGGVLKNKALKNLLHRWCLEKQARFGSKGVIVKKREFDYEEYFVNGCARLDAIRIFIAYAAHKNMTVYQMDVKTTFLNSILREEAPRAWYDLLSSFLLSQSSPKVLLILHYSLGKKAKTSYCPKGIFLNQSKYALKIFKKYRMESCDPVDTPMVEKSKLDADLQGKEVDLTRYHGMIGSLMYLTASRPDLVFADSCITLTAYANADHAGYQYTRRSTSSSMQLLGDRLVSWSSKKQKSTTISHTEGPNQYPIDTSLVHIESHKLPITELFEVDSGRISIRHCTATYSASADDITVQSCFFNIQLTNLSPRNCIPPEVLLRVSKHPAWSTSEKAISSKPESFEY
ncbi:retrovirus-related pol polyprotein from transposon TNT 1-94 [Tanacetum coccineum]